MWLPAAWGGTRGLASGQTIRRARRKAFRETLWRDLEAVDRRTLPDADQLNYDLFRYAQQRRVELLRFPEDVLAMDLRGIGSAPDILLLIPQNPWHPRIRRIRGIHVESVAST